MEGSPYEKEVLAFQKRINSLQGEPLYGSGCRARHIVSDWERGSSRTTEQQLSLKLPSLGPTPQGDWSSVLWRMDLPGVQTPIASVRTE